MNLDVDQQAIADWRPADGHLKVEANPGTGKSQSAAALIGNLVSDGIPPARIVATTFSNRGARTIRSRVAQTVPEPYLSQLRLGTFHSLALRALRSLDMVRWDMARCTDAGGKSRAAGTPSTQVLWRSAVEYGKMPGTEKPSLRIKGADPDDYCKTAQKLMALGVRDARSNVVKAVELESFDDAWELVNEAKAHLGVFDFCDVLFGWRDYLLTDARPDAYADVIVVDEQQDTNALQASIVKALIRFKPDAPLDGGRLVRIGDPKQAIMGFAGADAKVFEDVPARTLYLTHNYRSGRKIVDLSNKLVDKWQWGTHSKLTRSETEGRVVLEPLNVDSVVENARAAIAQRRSFAFLSRTNAELAPLQAAFVSAGVPYTVVGQNSLFQHREVETVLCYCVLAQHDSLAALDKVLNRPKRFLGKVFTDAMKTWIATEVAFHRTPTLLAGVAGVIEALPVTQKRGAKRLYEDIKDLRETPWNRVPDKIAGMLAKNNVSNEVRKATTDPDEDSPALYAAALRIARKFDSASDFVDFGDRCNRLSRSVSEDADVPKDRAILCSAHRYKSQEADICYVLASDKRFPHPRCTPEEENRLFFVACTRARDVLIGCFDGERGPSPYLKLLEEFTDGRKAGLLAVPPDPR